MLKENKTRPSSLPSPLAALSSRTCCCEHAHYHTVLQSSPIRPFWLITMIKVREKKSQSFISQARNRQHFSPCDIVGGKSPSSDVS